MGLKLIQSLWKAVKYTVLTAQDKQGTHEQLSQNMKTVVDHPGNDRRFKGMSIFGTILINSVILSRGVCVNICYVK